MRILGLTGGIACGKSYVSFLLKHTGCVIVDGDRIAHSLTAPGGEALSDIRTRFGDAVFDPDGALNRKALGHIVFSDPAQRDALNALMQPRILQRIHQEIEEARSSEAAFCVLDMPLLFEEGLDALCEGVICVYLPRDTQLKRLMDRDGITREDAEKRMNAQLSTEEKAARSQYVIDNSGSREETRAQVNALMQTLSAPRRRRSSSPVSVQCPTEAMESGSTPAPPENVSSPSDRPLPDTVNLRRRVTVPAPAKEPACNPSPIARESRHASRDISTSREDTPVSKDAPPLPQALRTVCIVLVFLAMASVCACALMQSYLFARAQAREAAYQAQLTSHPVRYRELIETYAAQYNLQPAYVEAIILNESSYDPKAESRVGARGLMQIMEDTAEWIAHRLNRASHSFDDLWDPETNIQFGCWYLSYLSSLFGGDPIAVTCAYHAGQGTVGQWLSNPAYTGGTSSLILDLLPTGPTKTYAGRVSQAYGVYDALYYHVLNPLPDTAADSAGE